MRKARKGFTLVELLIVIVIIGILAGGMMLSSGSATAAAEATTIVSDLRNLKAAALVFFLEEEGNVPSDRISLSSLLSYMDNPGKISTDVYNFKATGGKWYVGQKVSNPAVRERLARRAASANLVGSNAIGTPPTSTDVTFNSTHSVAWMVAR